MRSKRTLTLDTLADWHSELNLWKVPKGLNLGQDSSVVDKAQLRERIQGAFSVLDKMPGVKRLSNRKWNQKQKIMGHCFHTKRTAKNCRHFVMSEAVAAARRLSATEGK